MEKPNKTLMVTARAVEVLLGAVFIAGAVLKALDINLFVVQISHYGVLSRTSMLLAPAALGTLALESALGVAMFLGWRPGGWPLRILPALLVVFTALIAYGWAFHDLQDCGCFGRLEMSPAVSVVKNLVLFALWAVAWTGLRTETCTGFCLASKPSVVKGIITLVFVAALQAYAIRDLEPRVETGAEARPFAEFQVATLEGILDLGEGEYLVVILSATCEHCMEEVASINELAMLPDFPTIVGLCEGNEESVQAFKDFTSPAFPIKQIGLRTFNTFVGEEPPRFYYVRNGNPVALWDYITPEAGQVQNARTQEDAVSAFPLEPHELTAPWPSAIIAQLPAAAIRYNTSR